jgi:hypothetical protein
MIRSRDRDGGRRQGTSGLQTGTEYQRGGEVEGMEERQRANEVNGGRGRKSLTIVSHGNKSLHFG